MTGHRLKEKDGRHTEKYAGLVSSGSMPDFQSEGVGSIPTTRTSFLSFKN